MIFVISLGKSQANEGSEVVELLEMSFTLSNCSRPERKLISKVAGFSADREWDALRNVVGLDKFNALVLYIIPNLKKKILWLI